MKNRRTNPFSEKGAFNINRNIFKGDLFLVGVYCDADPVDNGMIKNKARLRFGKEDLWPTILTPL